MSDRETILNSIKANKPTSKTKIANDYKTMKYENKITKFIEAHKSVGGIVVDARGSIKGDLSKALGNVGTQWSSAVGDIDDILIEGYKKLDKNITSEELASTDLGIIAPKIGVAENGAVWIEPRSINERTMLFAVDTLVSVLSVGDIVDTMPDAYAKVKFDDDFFSGYFISGPSKTADIEQALVIGAHGPTRHITVLV